MDVSMQELLEALSDVCSMFALKYNPEMSADDLEIISHKVNCALFEATADATGIDVEDIFQSLKWCMDVDDERKKN